ncbi:hypothetical protein CPB86DRAFT_790053 [Serendipita vermifera]|nr:hypothetical protein CPB86DRAFT_790053 [Serendipita vermifera]
MSSNQSRFARLKTDPRFRKPKKHAVKVQIDPRFSSVLLKEDKFGNKSKVKVDKYGRKRGKADEQDTLRNFYQLPEDGKRKLDYARGEGLIESSSEGENEGDDGPKLKRISSDSEDEEDSEEDDEDVVLGRDAAGGYKSISILQEEVDIDLDESQFADLDAQAELNISRDAEQRASDTTVKPTRRIAAVNLDWDYVKASHLFKVFSSQLSLMSVVSGRGKSGGALTRGQLLHVRIYPSEFGKKRMAEEDKAGPPVEVFRQENDKGKTNGTSKDQSDSDEDNTKKSRNNTGEDYDQEALRAYQLERLRYYYAIATFDTVDAASYVYNELEGTELERSANLLDLSYVPEDMEFAENECTDEAAFEVTIGYRPLNFATDALRHSNVKLTWDDDDPERTRITRRNLSNKEMDEMDFKDLIASSSGEDSDGDTSGQIDKQKSRMDAQELRKLLLSGNDELPEGWGGVRGDKTEGMVITFTPGLSEHPTGDTDGLNGKSKKPEEEYETTLERYQRKRKEKKKAKKKAREEARHEHKEQERGEKSRKKEKKARVNDAFFEADSDEGSSDEEEGKRLKGSQQERRDEENVATDAELALLLADPSRAGKVKHFDMTEIMRAEKRAGKSDKYKKKRKRKVEEKTGEEGGADDNFEINLEDPRFKSVLEDHQFAIDPAHPSFKKTKNMKRLLEKSHSRNSKDDISPIAAGRERKHKRPRRD